MAEDMNASDNDLPAPTAFVNYDIQTVAASTSSSFKEYLNLVQRGNNEAKDLSGLIQAQSIILLDDLRSLQKHVQKRGDAAEGRRWVKVAAGGGIITAAPGISSLATNLVGKWFAMMRNQAGHVSYKHPSHTKSTATIAFSLFAAFYVCHNEILIRACDNMTKRLNGLYQTVEQRGKVVDLDEEILEDWRWSIIYGL